MTATRLCIFARVPRPGVVKRRLAATLGDVAALRAHDLLVRDTLVRLAAVPGMVSELWLDDAVNAQVEAWLEAHPLPVRRQVGADLGARMHHALGTALENAAGALLVGSDCPTVDAPYVRQAAHRLRRDDVVLGPAEDGGYALIGARRQVAGRLAPLFEGVAWGSASVLRETLERTDRAGLSCGLLTPVWDVDDVAGWDRFLALRREPP